MGSLPSDHRVLQSDGQGVSNVQVARDVGGRESDAESASLQWLAVLLVSRLEEALGVPPVVVSRLDLDRVVAGGREVSRDICDESTAPPPREVCLPFFSPGGVVLTNSTTGGASFFSFSFFSFLAPPATAGAAALRAALAAFSSRFASFLA